jgi:hypothetical protein
MKGIINGLVVAAFFVILFLSVNWVVGGIFDAVDEEKAEKSEIVGEDVVISSDTLTIVDYKLLTEKYVLSNGVEISEDYANSLLGEEK